MATDIPCYICGCGSRSSLHSCSHVCHDEQLKLLPLRVSKGYRPVIHSDDVCRLLSVACAVVQPISRPIATSDAVFEERRLSLSLTRLCDVGDI